MWSDRAKRLTVVDVEGGHTVTTTTLPDVTHILTSSPESGDLYAAGHDGRVIRLVPRN